MRISLQLLAPCKAQTFLHVAQPDYGVGSVHEWCGVLADGTRHKLSFAIAVRVRCAGGVHTLEQCQQLVEAGASALGTSSGPQLIQASRQPQPRRNDDG